MIKRSQIACMNSHFNRYSFSYFLENISRIGYSSLEFWMGGPHFWLDGFNMQSCREVRDGCRNHGLRVVATTTPSMAYQYQYSPLEAEFTNYCFDYFCKGIQATVELGASIMTVNTGWGYRDGTSQYSFEQTVELLGRLSKVAAANGVVLMLESLTTMESSIGDNLEKVISLWREINHPNIKLMCDTVAVWNAGETLEEWFEATDGDICHMHFIDHVPGQVTHYAWGDGKVPLTDLMKRLKQWDYKGYLTQEYSPGFYGNDPTAASLRGWRMLEPYCKD